MSSLLNRISEPADLRGMSIDQLDELAEEIRQLIIRVVSTNRGHLASNLGVVELTLALHYCYDFAVDRLVWDCGHQAYTHKIVTGRRREFETLRQREGISGFADWRESCYDAFHFGHTATSISAALGLACADATLGRERDVVAVIGDGAVASGMAFEALNHAGASGRDLLVVLNDNKMSISRSVGAIARYLSRLRTSKPYTEARQELQDLVAHLPLVAETFEGFVGKVADGIQTALTPGGLFVDLGFRYYGPVNGHSLPELVSTIRHMRMLRGPRLVHVLTEKGRGFEPARKDPTRWHSSKRFDLDGEQLSLESPAEGPPSWSQVFGRAICERAESDERIVAITAAMPDGTGLTQFAERFPDRYYNVGICEQHAVGLASGLARGGLRPVFAVYSTFLQRAFDQIHHDAALQEAPIVFCVDRAGLVGSDGPTHHGLYDVGYCRAVPGLTVMAPRNAAELVHMLGLALSMDKPSLIRYPREDVPPRAGDDKCDFGVGEGELCREGADGAIIAFGATVPRALVAARILAEELGIEVAVVNARFAAPLDEDLLADVVRQHPAVIIAEDHCVAGGFGAAVLELLSRRGVCSEHVRLAGVPVEFVAHATRAQQFDMLGLDGPGLAGRLRTLIREVGG